MSEFVTDAMVEAAAIARWDYERAESGDTTEWGMRYTAFREFDLDSMRAALEAVAPLIAAKVLWDAADAINATPLVVSLTGAPHAVHFLRARADRIERGES